MTSSKLDKNFTSAVSNFVYNLIAKDLSEPPEQRHIFHASIAEVRFVVPFPSFVEAWHHDVVVISRDAIQDLLVHQRCIGRIGFVLYKCQQHQLIEVTNAVLHDDADPAACVLTIEDGHSLLSPFEHLASFSLQYRSITHLINKTVVFKDTDVNEEPFLRSSRILGVFLQASDSSKIVRTKWSFENSSEVWLADNKILTPTVVKKILTLPGVRKIRSLNKPPFHTTLAANDRICFQILFSHHGTRTSEFVRTTLCPLDAIAVKILEMEHSSGFQRKCLLLSSTPKDRKTFDHAFVPPYKVCMMSLDVLKEPQIDALTKILQKLKVFHYVLPRKSIFIFGHGTCMEALRIKCVEKNITIPIGRKQGSLQVTFEGLEGEPRNDSNGFPD